MPVTNTSGICNIYVKFLTVLTATVLVANAMVSSQLAYCNYILYEVSKASDA